MACKYKFGDKVEVNGHKGKITSIYQRTNNPGYICTVTFDDTKLIPNKMDFKEEMITMIGDLTSSESVKKERKCTCGIAITYGKIPVENHSDYCELKKPEKKEWNPKINKNFSGKTKPPGAYSNDPYDDLLEQFEQMLGTDDDDDDDFGFYGI